MATIVFGITAVGVFMVVLGWAIPQLRAIPSLQRDGERGTGEDVRKKKDIHEIMTALDFVCVCVVCVCVLSLIHI